ncbi:hypothetical protein [Peribacillus simplex]|uniref:hypothetical protein n=1 Tax=Peribacillus simplex TaxID=1478 RepID=UPI003D2D97E4
MTAFVAFVALTAFVAFAAFVAFVAFVAFAAFVALAAFAALVALAALHCCPELQQASPAAELVGMGDRPPADKDHDMASYSPLYPGYEMDT